VLVWIEARDPDTGNAKPMGIWDGRDNQQFEVASELRPFYGAGNIQELGVFRSEAGLTIQNYSLPLAAFSPEVRELLRGRDVRFAKLQIYLVSFDPETGAQLGVERIFTGFIDSAPETIGEAGGDASATLNLVSNARLLTRKVPVLKSHAAQSKRDGDAFFKYADVSGSVPVFWGKEKHTG
jgi:hypothetical protein